VPGRDGQSERAAEALQHTFPAQTKQTSHAPCPRALSRCRRCIVPARAPPRGRADRSCDTASKTTFSRRIPASAEVCACEVFRPRARLEVRGAPRTASVDPGTACAPHRGHLHQDRLPTKYPVGKGFYILHLIQLYRTPWALAVGSSRPPRSIC